MFEAVKPIYCSSDIRSIEHLARVGAEPSLMERAGRAAAEEAVRLTMDRSGPVLIACGPGNNGGDGFVMARRLLQAKRTVYLAFAGDPGQLPDDARAAHAAWLDAGGTIHTQLPETPDEGWALVVDALFGIGLKRPLSGQHAEWIHALNTLAAPRLAIDLPSGLNADTGAVLGSAFRATHTLTFIALKPGLLTLDGTDHAGTVTVRTLDLDPVALLPPKGWLVRPALFRSRLRGRPQNSHKGNYGDVGIIGGARGMTGATLLAARAALKLGAGRVMVGCLDPRMLAVDPVQPELMLRTPLEVIAHASVLAVGPGLGLEDEAAALLESAISSSLPLVLDADALTLLGNTPALRQLLERRLDPTLLTPHPAEAARLLDTHTAEIQSDRVGHALRLATRYRASVVLKGSGSVIATPSGEWFINRTGHPGMATGGMGDVLTGLIASLIAQHWPTKEALIAAVHLHGASGDRLAREGVGPVGLTASEVIDASRGIYNGWLVLAGQATQPAGQ